MEGHLLRRRECIALFGGMAVWPLAARAQPTERMRRVAIFMAYADDDAETKHRVAEFRRALEGVGWLEGRNIQFEHRNAAADPTLRRAYAMDLVSRAPDVILANTVPVTAALKEATTTIPIVFAGGGDPVAAGLVASLARPGGNITGFPVTEPSLAGKWLELLREIAPGTQRVAVLHAPENPIRLQYLSAISAANARLNLDIVEFNVQSGEQIERAIDTLARAPNTALLVLPGASTSVHRNAIITAAARNRLPAVYPFRYFATSGGLVAYGADNGDLFRRAASYVDRILRGEKPANLPI